MQVIAVITFSSDTKVISICSLITGAFSLKLSLALGLRRKTSRTGLGMFSKPVIGDVVSDIRLVFGTWPSTFARVGEMSTICSGVAVTGSTTGPFWTPSTLYPPVSSGESNSCPMVGFKTPFSYFPMRRGDPHTIRCCFIGWTIRKTSTLVMTCSSNAFLNKVDLRRDNATFLWEAFSTYWSFSFPLELTLLVLFSWTLSLRINKKRRSASVKRYLN